MYQDPRAMIRVHRVYILHFGGQTRRVESSINPVANATQVAQYVFRGIVIDIYVFHYYLVFIEFWYIFYTSNR
jgi:hypothetical protein